MSTNLEEPATNRISVSTKSEFACALEKIIAKRHPQKLIETGTHVGLGTTTIIASALKENGLDNAQFHSIEVNPLFYLRACRNLLENGLARFVTLSNGVSVPRGLLPTAEEIRAEVALAKTVPDVFLDHADTQRVDLYLKETHYDTVEDDLLGACLARFGYEPDFLLLDSAGHMGRVEYQYVLQHIKGPCVIAFDDVRHIKHYQSLAQLRRDPRFKIIAEGSEKFGYCIAEFTPAPIAKISIGETGESWICQYLDRTLVSQSSSKAKISSDLLEAYANWKKTSGSPLNDPRPIEALLRCHPQHGEFYTDLGVFLRASGRSHQARQMFESAARFAPEDARGWQELARHYYCEVGNTALAMALCRHAMRSARFNGHLKSVIEEKSGFHPWEGDFCWLDREANFLVHTNRLNFPADLEFTLTGADAWCYGGRPFPVTVSNSDMVLKRLVFAGNQHREKVVVPLSSGQVAEPLKIESSAAFIPSEINKNSQDSRRLSVRIGELALHPRIDSESANEEQLKKFLASSIE